ncbi:MAG TPA: hypothetical protein VGR48_15460 [Terriglobales bacterium]|nr:hypothetical protein [Terriglobales bacterium]
MKTYRTPRDLEASIEGALLRRARSLNATPLDEVAEILGEGRHYSWIGIYLVAGERPSPAADGGKPASRAASQKRAVFPIGLGQHVFGAIEVQSERGKRLTGADRVLLKRVAERVARYLHGPGAFLVRKAREAAMEQPQDLEARHQPESEKTRERTLAAAGEGRR